MSAKSDETWLELSLLGVPLESAGANAPTKFIVISGTSPPGSEAKSQIDQTLQSGGMVLVWHPRAESLEALNALLPQALQLTRRTSTSLVPIGDNPLTAGITAADLYFTELKPDVILEAGLGGPLIDAGHPLLAAPAVDWRVWNNKAEIIKTGSVARSEAETHESGVAMSETAIGTGRIVVCNLSGLTAIAERVAVGRRLLANLGIALQPARERIAGGIFTNAGVLRKALFCGRFAVEMAEHGDAGPGAGTALPPGPASDNPKVGTKIESTSWKESTADDSLTFDLNHMGLAGVDRDSAVYVSFWINSTRSLDDVLSEPDVPRVDLIINGSDKAAQALLNGKPLRDDSTAAGKSGAKSAFVSMVLKRGWNHLLIRVVHHDGDWKFAATLRCSNSDFLSELHAATQQPSE
jgi:beta-galactosidase